MSRLEEIEADFPGLLRDVPLRSLDEPDCIAAIGRVTDLIGISLDDDLARASNVPGFMVRFVLPTRAIDETEFYDHVRAKCPGAVPALRTLIETFTARWSFDYISGGITAAYALAELDEPSLPLVAKHFPVIDAEHNGEFDGEKVQALVAKHGWTPGMVDFVIAWLAQTDNNWFPGTEARGLDLYGYDVSPNWWMEGGLRDAAKALGTSGAEFARRCLTVLTEHGHAPDEEYYFGNRVTEGFYVEYFERESGRRWPKKRSSLPHSVLRLLPQGEFARRAVADSFVDLQYDWAKLVERRKLDNWDLEFFIEIERLVRARVNPD
jgi:hypothetical protein